MKARIYQREAVDRAFDAWAKGERAHLLVAPTGAGKTLVEAMVAKRWIEQRGGRVLVLAQDSRELVRQLAQAMRRHTRFAVGVEMGDDRVSRSEPPPIVCGSVQTVSRRAEDFGRDSFHLIIQDEADHAAASTWQAIADAFPRAKIFGCTATPHRHDGVRVPFDSAHRAATHQELIDAGHIAQIEVRDVRVVDRARIVLPGRAPATPEAVEAIWKSEGHLHEIVEPTIRLAATRSTIVFTPTIERAEQVAAMFNRYRPDTAAAISGKTPRPIRAGILEQFEARNLQYLVNVGVIGRGIDFPFVSCIVMARVTHSRTVYEQAIGRGWRAHPDKQRLLVLDFCENADRHRLLATFALLTGRDADEETLERARERLEESYGGEIGEALDSAQHDLMDSEVRKRIRAAIAVSTRTVDLLTDSITEDEWRTKSDRQIGREYGLDRNTVRTRRPPQYPSPNSHPNRLSPVDWDAQPLGKLSDQYIAMSTGRSLASVVEARTRRGIAAPPRSTTGRVTLVDRMKGAIPDEEFRNNNNRQLANRYEVSVTTIQRLRPAEIRSPARTGEERAAGLKAWWASLTPDERYRRGKRAGDAGWKAIQDLPASEREAILMKQREAGRDGASALWAKRKSRRESHRGGR